MPRNKSKTTRRLCTSPSRVMPCNGVVPSPSAAAALENNFNNNNNSNNNNNNKRNKNPRLNLFGATPKVSDNNRNNDDDNDMLSVYKKSSLSSVSGSSAHAAAVAMTPIVAPSAASKTFSSPSFNNNNNNNHQDDDFLDWEKAVPTSTAWSQLGTGRKDNNNAIATPLITSSYGECPSKPVPAAAAATHSNRIQRSSRGVFGGGSGGGGPPKMRPFGSSSNPKAKSLSFVEEADSEEDPRFLFDAGPASPPSCDRDVTRCRRSLTEELELTSSTEKSSTSESFKSEFSSSSASARTAASSSSRRLFHRANSLQITSSSSSGRANTWPPPHQQRRNSLTAGSISSFCGRSHSETLTSSSMHSSLAGADNHKEDTSFSITDLTAVEELSAEDPDRSFRAVKKHRARRNSIQGSIAPLSDSQQKSFAHLSQSVEDWKRSAGGGSLPAKGAKELGDLFSGSPARSVSSNRKRSVEDGSPSEYDDFLSISHNSSSSRSDRLTASRQRSCILSPPIGGSLGNFATRMGSTDLPFALDETLSIPPPIPQRGCAFGSNFSPDHTDFTHSGGRVSRHNESDDEDGDADCDDDDFSRGHPEASFDMMSGCNSTQRHRINRSFLIRDDNRPVETEQDVFDTMSSYADLKFLISSLRKEHKKGCHTFGVGDNWAVIPKKDWSSTRRSAFFQWTTSHFGFSVRVAGGSVNFLQIKKTQGTEILALLERALLQYKQNQISEQQSNDIDERKNSSCSIPPPPGLVAPNAGLRRSPLLFMESTNYSARKAIPMDTDRSFQLQRPPTFPKSTEDGMDLVQSMGSLDITMESAPRDSFGGRSGRSSMSSFGGRPSLSMRDRLSFDSVGTGRASLDHRIASSSDMMYHIHARTPNVFAEKSQRLSLASIQSACTNRSANTSNRLSAPFSQAPSFDIVETPLVKQDDGHWGSCPVQGRDWGSSCRCDNTSLDQLTNRMEESARDAGARESSDAIYSSNGRACAKLNFQTDEDEFRISEEVGGSKLNFQVQVDSDEDGFDEEQPLVESFLDGRQLDKKKKSYAKHRRVSVFFSAASQSDRVFPSMNEGPFRGRKTSAPIDLPPLIGENKTCIEEEQNSLESFSIEEDEADPKTKVADAGLLENIFAFLTEGELFQNASPVCTSWSDAATSAHANLMLASVGYKGDDVGDEDIEEVVESNSLSSVSQSMERSWDHMTSRFPWGQFLAEGGMKKVYRVWNAEISQYEAVSVMDIENIEDIRCVGAELAVSAMLSSLARRAICPNFLLTRGVFTCAYQPPLSHWGCEDNKKPLGKDYNADAIQRRPRRPSRSYPGRYQFIRTELCAEGDAEEFIKRRPDEVLPADLAQSFVFQIAFALHAAAVRFSVKHYDIKLLNIFVQPSPSSKGDTVLRYGLGSHVFALRMSVGNAFVAKVADYGTANVSPASNGHPVTIAQFTTLENTPADFMILGDKATQGHGHDCFGLGLCMLHLFTGHRPYEEIMESVKCPPVLKKKLRAIWEDEDVEGYDVIRSVILADVYKDEAGHIIEGEPDETFYDTLYRFLVLFGIPTDKFHQKECPLVWQAITGALGVSVSKAKGCRPGKRRNGADSTQFNRDRRQFSLQNGKNKYIARARNALTEMDGGMELLFKLCAFNPDVRASALDVLNSQFMVNLRETADATYDDNYVASFTAFATAMPSCNY